MGISHGYVQIYTGEGKGKTTAALGLALRAVGRGLTVVMIQFLKGDTETGERNAAQNIKGLRILPMGRAGFVTQRSDREQDGQLARGAIEEAKRTLEARECDVLILDEVNVAVALGLVDESDVLNLLDLRPQTMELVLTGRGAPQSFIERAHLVTTMQCTKHYFGEGLKARKGIEY